MIFVGIRLRLVTVSALIIALGVLSSCANQKQTIRLGYLPLSPSAAVLLANENGLFSTEGLRVELVKYASGAQLVDDLVAAKIDAATPGPLDVYLDRELHGPGRFAIYLQSAYTESNYIYSLVVRRDSGIESLAGLHGKTIAVFPGPTNEGLVALMLHKLFGWSQPADFRIKSVPPQSQLDLLEKGDYDALIPLEPTGTFSKLRSDLTIAERAPIERSLLSPLFITAHALSSKFIRAHPKEAASFVRAVERGVDIVRASRDSANTVLEKYCSVPPELASNTPIGDYYKVREIDQTKVQALADLLAESGAITQRVQVSDLFFKNSE